MDQNPSSSKTDRKTVEKNRRNHMKALYSQLNSLVPYPDSSSEVVSLTDQLDAAANYIKKLQSNIEKMKQKKNHFTRGCSKSSSPSCEISPNVEVRVMSSILEVVLVTGLNSHVMFCEAIRILHEEEGVEVENASFSVVDSVVFHTIHSKIGESALKHGAASRVSERLKRLV